MYLIPQLAVFVSPGNLVLGGLLAALLALNVAVAALAAVEDRSCLRTRYAGVLGTLPAFLTGFACCVPSVLLLLGASVAAVFVPVFVPLRPYLFPLSLLLVTSTLAWNAHRRELELSGN